MRAVASAFLFVGYDDDDVDLGRGRVLSDFYFWNLTGGILRGVLEWVGGSVAGDDDAWRVMVGGRVGGLGVEGGDVEVDEVED